MKAVVFSDLHLPISDLDYRLDFPADVQLAIIAGDVAAPVSASLRWIYEHVVSAGLSVIFVAGNHEYYGHILEPSFADAMTFRSRYSGLHWLENESVVISGVRFLGTTLWTDYELYERPEESMQVALLRMNDHRMIHRTGVGGQRARFYPEDASAIHQASRAWLEGQLSEQFDGPTVVVSHHCPHPGSIHAQFAGNPLNPAFTSDLSQMIERYQPTMWVHGHTHTSFDYHVGRTRVVCNPRGYVRSSFGKHKGIENPDFLPFKVVEI